MLLERFATVGITLLRINKNVDMINEIVYCLRAGMSPPVGEFYVKYLPMKVEGNEQDEHSRV